MFKNKTLQMKLISDEKFVPKNQPAQGASLEEIIFYARQVGQDVVVGGAILIGVYVGADTIRRVFDNRSKKR